MNEIGSGLSSLELLYRWKKDALWMALVAFFTLLFSVVFGIGYYLHVVAIEALTAAHERQMDGLLKMVKETGKIAKNLAQ